MIVRKMKNKNLKILAVAIPVLLAVIIGYLFYSFQQKKSKIETLQHIPSFSVKDIYGKTVSNQNLPKGNKILVYFSPDCEFCQTEMEALSKINKNHKNIHWIMFSSSSIKEISNFAQKYNLENTENISWCEDPMAKVYTKFAMKGMPYFLGYNSENKLIHRSTGAIKIEKILADFHEKE